MSGAALGSPLPGVKRNSGGGEAAEASSLPLGPEEVRGITLEPVELELVRGPGPLLDQIQAAVVALGQPLRWAITAVEPGAGGGPEGSRLRIEAVVQR